MLQPIEDLEKWHQEVDPWKYESTPDDSGRKAILLGELPNRDFKNVLEIGCGQGFLTRDLPGKRIVGVDISAEAIQHAKQFESDRISFVQASLFELPEKLPEKFDLIIIAGVLYPQYIANSLRLVELTLDQLLEDNGILVSVHIHQWYKARFPYLMLKNIMYDYREYTHLLEVYVK